MPSVGWQKVKWSVVASVLSAVAIALVWSAQSLGQDAIEWKKNADEYHKSLPKLQEAIKANTALIVEHAGSHSQQADALDSKLGDIKTLLEQVNEKLEQGALE